MKSLYSELGKMIVHLNKLPHPSLSQSQWDNASTYLFPFVSMDTWKNTDFQFLFFSLSLLFFPFPYLLSLFFPFFLAIDNTKVFFFPEGCSNINLHYEKIQTVKLEEKQRLLSEHLIIQQLKPVTSLKNSFLPLPSLHIYWGPSSYQRLNECFSYSNSFFFSAFPLYVLLNGFQSLVGLDIFSVCPGHCNLV